MEDRLYTVKDIAAAISLREEPEEVKRVMRQVRHWTNHDLIETVGGKDTGTGVSRVYRGTEVYKAAIIAELIRFGVTVDMLETFNEWIPGVMDSAYWKASVERGEDFYLQFVFDPINGSSLWKPHLGDEPLILSAAQAERLSYMQHASAILVNVALIAKRVRL